MRKSKSARIWEEDNEDKDEERDDEGVELERDKEILNHPYPLHQMEMEIRLPPIWRVHIIMVCPWSGDWGRISLWTLMEMRMVDRLGVEVGGAGPLVEESLTKQDQGVESDEELELDILTSLCQLIVRILPFISSGIELTTHFMY
jgi:hypothetical protein